MMSSTRVNPERALAGDDGDTSMTSTVQPVTEAAPRIAAARLLATSLLQFLTREIQGQRIQTRKESAAAPEEDKAYNHRLYSYLLGGDVLVAPVVRPGEDTRRVWLPEGRWIHLWSGEAYGGGEAEVPAPLGQPPVFWRAESGWAPVFRARKQDS